MIFYITTNYLHSERYGRYRVLCILAIFIDRLTFYFSHIEIYNFIKVTDDQVTGKLVSHQIGNA